jgi:hypothetical protein
VAAERVEVLLHSLCHFDFRGDDREHLVAAVSHLLRIWRKLHKTLHTIQKRYLHVASAAHSFPRPFNAIDSTNLLLHQPHAVMQRASEFLQQIRSLHLCNLQES